MRRQLQIGVALIVLSLCCNLPNALNPRSQSSSRRRFVEASAAGVLSSAACLALVDHTTTVGGGVVASAAPPVAREELEAGAAQRLLRAIRPKPLRLLRPRLNKDFAVLLMRSSYNALDDLDCVAMDQFQRDFFLIRQGTVLGGGVRQPQLTRCCIHQSHPAEFFAVGTARQRSTSPTSTTLVRGWSSRAT
jgi:hypothetical protein